MTFTKEQLIEQAKSSIERYSKAVVGFPRHLNVAMDLELARIALASLEAEPVVENVHSSVIAEQLAHVLSGMKVTSHERAVINCAVDRLNKNAEVQQTPPAPVSVPDFDEWSRKCDLQIALCDPEFREKARYIWDEACRAAMLQSAEPVTTANKLRDAVYAIRNSGIAIDGEKIKAERDALNSPVIPDGWVACSERMPEEDGNYWGWWSESKRQGPVWFIKSDLQAQFQSSEITHWMPLPAAPQQEVK